MGAARARLDVSRRRGAAASGAQQSCCSLGAHLSGTIATHLSVTVAKQGSYANDQAHGPGKRMYAGGDTFEVRHSHAAVAAPLWAPLSVHYCVQGDFRNGKPARYGKYTW